MSSVAQLNPARRPSVAVGKLASGVVMRGAVTGYLSLIVLIPLAAVIWRSTGGGLSAFWQEVSSPAAMASLRWTLLASLIVVGANAVAGTATAWVLVRDRFPGKAIVNAVIDLPFALPTIVAGLTLITLYGPNSPLGLHAAYTRTGVVLALLFVTLPFVVRAVQPVLMELDREMEEAAASLGARPLTVFRRIILPNLLPAVLSGCALSFTRAMGEFGSVVLISGGLSGTEVASMRIFGDIQSDNEMGAAAISMVLLALSLLALLAITFIRRWSNRHAG